MSSRRLAEVYKLTHLSFQLLLPLDSLPLVGQSIGIRHNNRSRHSRTSWPMMADGNEATSLVLREIASICKGPCTPGTGNSRHIWQTSSGYLWGTSGGRLRHELPRGKTDDCWMPSRVQKTLWRSPVPLFDKKAQRWHRDAIMYPTDVPWTSKNSSNAVRVLDVHWISDTWREVSS